MTLVINAAIKPPFVALTNSGFADVINFESGLESREILAKIEKILAQNNVKLEDVRDLIVVKGPGSFTGLRVAVTIANILANFGDLELKEIDSFSFIKCRLKEKNVTVILASSRNDYFMTEFGEQSFDVEIKLVTKPELQKVLMRKGFKFLFYGFEQSQIKDLLDKSDKIIQEKDLIGLEESILNLDKYCTIKEIVEILYKKDPAISKSKKL